MNGRERITLMSKQWLIESIFQLMEKKPYQKITVTMIADNADLSRRTFYRYFKDKDDLLEYYRQKVFNQYVQTLKTRMQAVKKEAYNFAFVIDTLFNFWWTQRKYSRILIKQDLFISLFVHESEQLAKLYNQFQVPWHIQGSQDEIMYVLNFFIGGYFNVMNRWLVSEHPKDPHEISKTLYSSIFKLKSEN